MRFNTPKTLLLILLVGLGLAVPTMAKDDKKNLLENGGFETGQLAPWLDYSSKVEVIDSKAVEGKFCVKLLPVSAGLPSKAASVVAVSVDGLKPNTNYIFSGQVRVENSGDKVRVGAVGFDKSDKSTGQMKGHVGQIIDATTWTEFSLSFKTGGTDTTVLLMLAGDLILVNGPAYGDAFDLREQ